MTNGAQFRGVITDWGGVLTTPILTTVQAWIQADGIDWDSYRTVMRSWVFDAYGPDDVYDDASGPDDSRNPVHALERGECSGAEFEQMLAARLLRTDGGVVTAQGILQRMFAASTSEPAMYDMIRAVRGAGLRTGLLSNSWGCDEYPRADFPGLFDAVVISGECGMRKPEPAIFLHAATVHRPGPRAVCLHRRHGAERGGGRRVRHDRRAPHRGGADGRGRAGPARGAAQRDTARTGSGFVAPATGNTMR